MNIMVIGLFSLLAVGSWVIFDVYRAIVKTTVPVVLQTQILPLDPEIDTEVIGLLREKKRFDSNYLNTLSPRFLTEEGDIPTPAPTPVVLEESEIATESAETLEGP